MDAGTQVGAYRIVEQIGEGGMGAVFKAEHALLGRAAAIKILHPSFSAREDIVTRFFNEARAATAIADPGIVQIFDFGYHTDGSAYIVMELLQGETLDRRIRRSVVMPVEVALRAVRQVASSLAAAHARGIVHRDLKPENIFLVRDPEVPGGERAKILDFGVAKVAGEHAGVKTQTTALIGTPTYMSPEQCRGAGFGDQRSDVYSLACVLFVMLVGRPPFVADGVGEIIASHLREPAPRLRAYLPSAPPGLDELIARCLQKDPAARYRDAAELATAIDGLLADPSMQAATSARLSQALGEPPLTTTLGSAAVAIVV
jgi:serine/threonine-protein kinase